MFRNRFLCLLLALLCLLGLSGTAMAAEVDCDAVYCFSEADFAGEEPLRGICITHLPDSRTGTVLLGQRVLQPGDILTAQQLSGLTFQPLQTNADQDAVMTYLPIYDGRVATAATVSLTIRGKEDKAPVAQDSAVETYKNLPNEGKLKVSDPEGQALTFTLQRAPKRGTVELREDGSFLYTPKKNKVGVDSFTYTATDPAGNVSREATVTVQILKPTDSRMYTDTVGHSCRFAAEWMRNTGLFEGEKIGAETCFFPDKEVTRGQFLAMVVQALDIPLEDAAYSAVPADIPQWLRPYFAAALRSGLTAGWPESDAFSADEAITGAEAAVMLQNALDLSITQQTLETVQSDAQTQVPVWASVSLTAMAENGVALEPEKALTRADAAQVLYRISQLALEAPGMTVLRMQQ